MSTRDDATWDEDLVLEAIEHLQDNGMPARSGAVRALFIWAQAQRSETVTTENCPHSDYNLAERMAWTNGYNAAMAVSRVQTAEAPPSAIEPSADEKRYRWLRRNGDKGIYVIQRWTQGDEHSPLALAQGGELDTIIDEHIAGTR